MINFCVLLCGVVGLAGTRVRAAEYPTVVSEDGRDTHYFTTSGWRGLREGVVVARGLPLALTCDFRDKVRRVVGPDGVPRSQVVTKTTFVNITFPRGANQTVQRIAPTVNTFKGAWETYHPEATVFFPAVVSATEVQCDAEYVEDGQKRTSVIRISVTPRDGVPVWRRTVNLRKVTRVTCGEYEDLSKRLHNFSRELYQVVSLMVAGDSVITTVPRTSVLLPFTGYVLSQAGAFNQTKERLYTEGNPVKNNVTCVVYHVHRPEWGVYVTSYVKHSYVPWILLTVLCLSVVLLVVKLFTLPRSFRYRQCCPAQVYGCI